MNKKGVIILLLVLNAVVLLGQVYPEGVPPFARVVNIVFLVLSFVYFLSMLRGNKS